jgi:hypothetical protein
LTPSLTQEQHFPRQSLHPLGLQKFLKNPQILLKQPLEQKPFKQLQQPSKKDWSPQQDLQALVLHILFMHLQFKCLLITAHIFLQQAQFPLKKVSTF